MKVVNIHSREYPVASAEVGRLVDTLSSENDLLWPHQLWPRMKFDKPLAVSANGGHGPIRYFVEEYRRFRGRVLICDCSKPIKSLIKI